MSPVDPEEAARCGGRRRFAGYLRHGPHDTAGCHAGHESRRPAHRLLRRLLLRAYSHAEPLFGQGQLRIVSYRPDRDFSAPGLVAFPGYGNALDPMDPRGVGRHPYNRCFRHCTRLYFPDLGATLHHLYPCRTRTALIFMLEPVFAWITSCLLAGETLSARAAAGAGLILAGILAVELKPFPPRGHPSSQGPRPQYNK